MTTVLSQKKRKKITQSFKNPLLQVTLHTLCHIMKNIFTILTFDLVIKFLTFIYFCLLAKIKISIPFVKIRLETSQSESYMHVYRIAGNLVLTTGLKT